MKTFRIALLPGDGIGPEVIDEAVKVLLAAAGRLSQTRFELTTLPAGAGEYLKSGNPLPDSTFAQLAQFDAILLGAMGLPDVRWPNGTEMAPQVDLRERLDLYNGLRPIRLYHANHTPLKKYQAGEIDFVILRESTEGLFHSRKQSTATPDGVLDSLQITRAASERLFRAAFQEATKRKGLVTLVDKANILPSMAFFRRVFDEVASEFPGVRTERVYVDAASLFLVQRPETFDVIVTENMFGDILSDLAAGLVGGMGMAPSGDIGDRYAVFQPSHGTAPDIAGKGMANPAAAILSVALMLDWLATEETLRAAGVIRAAVEDVFRDGAAGTRDIGGKMTTREFGDAIASLVARGAAAAV